MSALTLLPARYRKGYSVIRCASDGSGFKTKLMHAVEKLGGQWVHRSEGYVLPEKKAARVFAILQRLERMEQRKFVAKSGDSNSGAEAPQRGPGEPFITPGPPSKTLITIELPASAAKKLMDDPERAKEFLRQAGLPVESITVRSPDCPVCGNPIADCPCDPRDVGFTPLSYL